MARCVQIYPDGTPNTLAIAPAWWVTEAGKSWKPTAWFDRNEMTGSNHVMTVMTKNTAVDQGWGCHRGGIFSLQ